MTDKATRNAAARLYAVQALFQMEAMDQSADRVANEFLTWRIGAVTPEGTAPDANEALFRSILDNVVMWQGRIDQMTDRALVAKWPIDRLDPVLRAAFRCAGAEMIGMDIPPRVVITQYLQVVQAFFGENRESRFVNAVLDHMAHEAHPEGF